MQVSLWLGEMLDDWQLEKVRTALRAHRAYTPGKSGRGLTWLELVADIEAYTGVAMSDEVARQFVQGTNKKSQNPVRYRRPDPENLAAIVSYLTHSDIGALSEDELVEDAFAYQVPLRLLEYLAQDFDGARVLLPEGLTGRYSAAAAAGDRITATVLALQQDPETGIIRVSETSEIYDHPGAVALREWRQQDRRNSFRARRSAEGWAVLTPEDSLLFFMKDRPYGRNHYWTLAADADLWANGPVGRLLLLRHDYPAELREGRDTAAAKEVLAQHFLGSLFAFERVERA